jgi:hypothetical protein
VLASKGVATGINKNNTQIKEVRLGEEDVKYTLLDCLETRNLRIKFLNQNDKI